MAANEMADVWFVNNKGTKKNEREKRKNAKKERKNVKKE
jgi:hypothetical protein